MEFSADLETHFSSSLIESKRTPGSFPFDNLAKEIQPILSRIVDKKSVHVDHMKMSSLIWKNTYVPHPIIAINDQIRDAQLGVWVPL